MHDTQESHTINYNWTNLFVFVGNYHKYEARLERNWKEKEKKMKEEDLPWAWVPRYTPKGVRSTLLHSNPPKILKKYSHPMFLKLRNLFSSIQDLKFKQEINLKMEKR